MTMTKKELMTNDYLLNREEIKEYLGIGDTYFTRLMADRHFPSFKVGREWRVAASDLRTWRQTQIGNKAV